MNDRIDRTDVAPALQELYEATYRRLVGVLTLATGRRDDAEEIAQEAFTRLIARWSRVSRFDDPAAWLRTVAFRLAIDRRRRLRRTLPWTPPAPRTARDEHALDIERAIAELPLGQRQVVLLHYYCDLTVNDVARTLGLAAGTVKSRLARARNSLAQSLDSEVIHDST